MSRTTRRTLTWLLVVAGCSIAVAVYATRATARQTQTVKIALWGDSRENRDGATERIAYILLHDITDWDVQVHTGDFTHRGREEDWQRTLHYKGIDRLFVKGKFLMCTSNHDADTSKSPTCRITWDRHTAGVLPTNDVDGTTHFYTWHKGSVHLIFCDMYFTDPQVMQNYVDRYVKTVPKDDWIVGVWHEPAYSGITYKKGSLSKCRGWLDAIASHGRGLVLNGHAHLYLRTKPLDPAGKEDDKTGLVHIINGCGGASWKPPAPQTPITAFTPRERSFPCITFLTFRGRKLSLKTVDARPDSNLKVIDQWTWSR